ncbi:Basic blue protein [Acorus gramineus]|uniref:Plantacyanin n=1 Tax=Acorus gramineus TaxID=55184 RepID=A0AAV9AJ50_ACOGR|nr:Basic blue protein [Acorus gramineus]
MMAQGRGSAAHSVILCFWLLCFVYSATIAEGATFVVGDSGGWTYNVVGWAKGKHFKAGDVLVFGYDATTHNVVAVDAKAYSSCSAPKGVKLYQTGNDKIKLKKGQNYFICSFPGHCDQGVKLTVNAA